MMFDSSNDENVKAHEPINDSQQSKTDENLSVTNPKVSELEENPKPVKKEEEVVKKKYGGLLAKKPPLISKDHERAFFDSADWALGKQGAQKSKGPLEALRPKLEPTPHQLVRTRLSSSSPADEGEGTTPDGENVNSDKMEEDNETSSDISNENSSQVEVQNKQN